jgi:hypothetical protein
MGSTSLNGASQFQDRHMIITLYQELQGTAKQEALGKKGLTPRTGLEAFTIAGGEGCDPGLTPHQPLQRTATPPLG